MEKTTNDKPADTARTQLQDEYRKLLTERFGFVPACGACAHAFPFRANLATTALECRESPPIPVWAPAFDPHGRVMGINVLPDGYVPSIVRADMFCSRFKPLPKKAN
jgi:hypothetical protein